MLLVLLVLIVLAGGLIVTVAYTGLPRAQVIEKLESLTGAKVDAGKIHLSADLGKLIINDLTLDLPDLDAPAGRVLTIQRVEVSLARRSLLAGKVRPTHVRLFEPTLRVSVDDQGEVNLTALAARRAEAPAAEPVEPPPSTKPLSLPKSLSFSPGVLPEIEVINASLQAGEHDAGDGGSFRLLETLRVSGVIRPIHEEQRAEIDLYELSNRPGSHAIAASGLRITGEIDAATNRVTTELTRIDLAEVDQLNPPSYIRSVWDRLQMSGQITRTRVLMGPSEGIVAEFSLEGVALNIPIDPLPAGGAEGEAGSGDSPGAPAPPLRMADVTGDIVFSADGVRADLTGSLNDFHAAVALNIAGYTASAPFDLNIRTTEPFRIAEQPDLLPYAPEAVKEISKRFGGPTGLVSAAIVVNRGDPIEGVPGRLITRGHLRISEGTGAFEHFPYPLIDVEASIGFEPEMVRIESVIARGPTGAMIAASGGIGPPGNEAGVDLRITAVQVPLDETFQRTLASNGMDLMPVLFNQEGYQRLRDAKLIQTRDEQAAAAQELAAARRSREAAQAVPSSDAETVEAQRRIDELIKALERQAAVPVFELGGNATLEINVHRPVGPRQHYTTDILVRIREAGLLPAEFPYPIIGRRLGIFIRDNDARVIETPFTTPTGGAGSIGGTVHFKMPDGDRDAFIDPHITIAAKNVPIDPLLLFALPRGGFGGSDNQTSTSVALASFPEALMRLGLTGMVSCQATVLNVADETEHANRLAVKAAIEIESLRADPLAGTTLTDAPLLEDVSASITLDDRSFTLHRLAGRSGTGSINATGSGTLGSDRDPQASSISLLVDAAHLDLSRRIERLIIAFVPEAAAEFANLRATHLPEGIVTINAGVQLEGDALDYRVDIRDITDASFDAFGRRVHLEEPTGSIAITPDAARFDGFAAALREESGHAVTTQLQGDFALRDGATSRLDASIGNGRFESPLLRRWLEEAAPSEAEALDAFQLAGTFDAELKLDGVRGTDIPLNGTLTPHAVALTWQGHRYDFPSTSGTIGLGNTGGSIIGLRGETDDWSFRARGVWNRATTQNQDAQPTPASGIGLTLEVDAKGRGFPKDVQALLPPDALAVLREQAFTMDAQQGRFTVDGARFIKEPADDGRILFEGMVTITGASITPGIHISAIDAKLDILAEKPAGVADAGVTINAVADHLNLFGLGFGPAKTRLLIGTAAGPAGGVTIPNIEVQGYGGLVMGNAAYPEFQVSNGVRTTLDIPPPFTLDLRMTDLDLGAMLDAAALLEPTGNEPLKATATQNMMGKRGTVDASLFMTGLLEQPATHRGRGEMLVEGGDILNIPGVVAVVKLANLMPGPDEPFSIATAAYSIRYDRVNFDSIVLEAPRSGTKLLGVGWMAIPSTELEMIFTPQAGRHVPLLSELFAGLRDEVARPYITGTLRNPVVEMRQLSRVRGMLGTIFATRQPTLPIPAASQPRE